MKYKLSLISLLIFLIASTNIRAQVTQSWAERYIASPGSFNFPEGMVTDAAGNIYVGMTITGEHLTDMSLLKYNPSGILQWERRFDGGIQDDLVDIAIDGFDNIYITGLTENQTGTFDILTIKYNAAGDTLWNRRYNAAFMFSMDQPTAMCVDDDNFIYVTGYTFGGSGSSSGNVTIKYDQKGDSVWVNRFVNGSANHSGDIATDHSGNIYVYTTFLGTCIIKINSAGVTQWASSVNIDGTINSKSLAVDDTGNVYFIGKKGTNSGDYATVKMSPSGDTLWMRTYNCSTSVSRNDEPASICIDGSNNVFVTGESYFAGFVWMSTLKYNSDGDLLWSRVYAPDTSGDGGNDIITDQAGNVYVTGCYNDFITIKYNTAGDSIWGMNYAAPGSFYDRAEYLILDNSDNVIVTGISLYQGSPSRYDISTVKYSQSITGISHSNQIPETFSLQQNYPNPFNPDTKIEFQLTQDAFVSLIVYDIKGSVVKELINESMQKGSHEYLFTAKELAGGIYFYKLTAGGISQTRKMILLK